MVEFIYYLNGRSQFQLLQLLLKKFASLHAMIPINSNELKSVASLSRSPHSLSHKFQLIVCKFRSRLSLITLRETCIVNHWKQCNFEQNCSWISYLQKQKASKQHKHTQTISRYLQFGLLLFLLRMPQEYCNRAEIWVEVDKERKMR